MLYQALADAVVLLHLTFIVFVVLGGVLVLRWRWLPWVHLPAVVWGGMLEFFGWLCPLTPLENALRRAGGSSVYSESFIGHYLLPIIYPADLTRNVQLFLGFALLLINFAIYSVAYRRHRSSET